ncbi:MAG: type II secretion system protein [Candidatus Colwellbacteria bacterium]|nr:type II secretion system protein [Candidatus Colwellbacteria bacterium]
MKLTKLKAVPGFTLIETLIYMGILAIVGTFLVTILTVTLRVQTTQVSKNEVNSQTNLVMTTVQRFIRDSSLIEKVYNAGDPEPEGPAGTDSTCTTNTTDFCTVVLRMPESFADCGLLYQNKNKLWIFYDLDDMKIKVQECDKDPQALTTDAVTVDFFELTKIEKAGAHNVLQIDLGMTYNTNNPTFGFSRTTQSAVSRVSAAEFDDNLLPNTDVQFDIGDSQNQWRNGYFEEINIGDGSLVDVYVCAAQGVGVSGLPTGALTIDPVLSCGITPPPQETGIRVLDLPSP